MERGAVESVEEGGDPACWAPYVCPECGAIEVSGHRPGCPRGADQRAVANDSSGPEGSPP